MAPTNTEGFIENGTNGKIFYFRAIVPFKIKKFQPSLDVPFVNQPPEDRVIFRFTGQAQDLNFIFVLFNDGQDVSNGHSIVTVKEQAEYLMDEIFTPEFDTIWGLAVSSQYTGTYLGVLENIDLDTNVGGNIRVGNVAFKRGKQGLL